MSPTTTFEMINESLSRSVVVNATVGLDLARIDRFHLIPNMAAIPPSVIRRVNRVRARMQPDNEPDEILDDVFVLCRAFEVTWSELGTETDKAAEAVAETIADHGIDALPQVRALIDALRAFQHASPLTCEEWFGAPPPGSRVDTKTSVVSSIRELRAAAARPESWTVKDSRKLGRLLYRMRCAVVHPSLETDNSLAIPILPAFRDALAELTVARTATRYGVPLTEARRQFTDAK